MPLLADPPHLVCVCVCVRLLHAHLQHTHSVALLLYTHPVLLLNDLLANRRQCRPLAVIVRLHCTPFVGFEFAHYSKKKKKKKKCHNMIKHNNCISRQQKEVAMPTHGGASVGRPRLHNNFLLPKSPRNHTLVLYM